MNPPQPEFGVILETVFPGVESAWDSFSSALTSIEAEVAELERSSILLLNTDGFDVPGYRESTRTTILR